MVMRPARQQMSFEQYLLLINNSDRRYEYHDGEVRLMAGGSSNHAAIALNFGSRSTEMTDRFVKLALYQAKESVQEIVYISQVIQRVELFYRSTTGWLYHQYGTGQSFHLVSLDIEIEVRQLYRRLSIPAIVEQVEEENESETD